MPENFKQPGLKRSRDPISLGLLFNKRVRLFILDRDFRQPINWSGYYIHFKVCNVTHPGQCTHCAANHLTRFKFQISLFNIVLGCIEHSSGCKTNVIRVRGMSIYCNSGFLVSGMSIRFSILK